MQVARQAVQAALRQICTQWGLPDAMRFDNGAPWGSWGDLPPDLALWLLGMGVNLIFNRPRHKQGNAVVERAHGVLQRWSDPATCADGAALQARLDALTTLQRERYPVGDERRSRLETFPTLASGGRPYAPDHEADLFDERRVWTALGRLVLTRRVDKVGRISLYNRARSVGRRWAGQAVSVRVVVREDSPLWEITATDGTVLAVHAATELSRERILALEVSHRRIRRPKAKAPARKEGYLYAR